MISPCSLYICMSPYCCGQWAVCESIFTIFFVFFAVRVVLKESRRSVFPGNSCNIFLPYMLVFPLWFLPSGFQITHFINFLSLRYVQSIFDHPINTDIVKSPKMGAETVSIYHLQNGWRSLDVIGKLLSFELLGLENIPSAKYTYETTYTNPGFL
jgi:hypothetical protein